MQPISQVRLYKNIPLDIEQNHTFSFCDSNENFDSIARSEYFENHLFKTFTEFVYIKEKKAIKVEAEKLVVESCNYMIFTNITQTFGKDYYCFITNMEWINPTTVLIYFDYDWLQTELMEIGSKNFGIKTAFIEREIVENDAIGLHTVSENLEIGEIVIDDTYSRTYHIDKSLLLGQIATNDEQNFAGSFVNGVFSPLFLTKFGTTASDINAINSILDKFKNTPEKIPILRVIPSACQQLITTVVGKNESFNIPVIKSLNGYIPKNNKLFSPPYCTLTAVVSTGQIKEYNLNDFNVLNDNITFNIKSVAYPSPCVMATPLNYKKVSENYAESVSFNNFPVCCWNVESYNEWDSKSFTVSNITAVADGVAKIGVNAVIGNYLGVASGVVGTASRIYNNVAGNEVKKMHSISLTGTAGETTVDSAFNQSSISFFYEVIRSEFAKIIDDFFTCFGYKVNITKQPNLTSRKYWNFCKCSNIIFDCDIELEARKAIKKAFENGLTIWHTTDIGNYTLNNEVR